MQTAKSISLHMLHAFLRRIIKNLHYFFKNCWGKNRSENIIIKCQTCVKKVLNGFLITEAFTIKQCTQHKHKVKS